MRLSSDEGMAEVESGQGMIVSEELPNGDNLRDHINQLPNRSEGIGVAVVIRNQHVEPSESLKSDASSETICSRGSSIIGRRGH
jgi:hypothetical protein